MRRSVVAACLLVAVAAAALLPARATKVVITDKQRRTLQVVSAGTSSGSLQGGQLKLPGDLGNVVYSAAAGDFAFTAGNSGDGTPKAKSSLIVTNIGSSSPKISKTVTFPGLNSGFFAGCLLLQGDMAARKVGSVYQLYVVVGCRSAQNGHEAGTYVAMYVYTPSSGKLSGPSTSRRYYVNRLDSKYGVSCPECMYYVLTPAKPVAPYVSVVNSMSVLGSGSGTVYIVLTTTSAVNGIVYKPALHVMKDSHAVPLGILAKPPSLPDGLEQPLFAIASPNSFYSVYRQKCHVPQGANHCATYPLNSKEVVTLTKQYAGSGTVGDSAVVYSYSPTAMAVSPTTNVLYKLRASPAAYSKGRSQAAYLTARSGSAASSTGFTTTVKLPYLPSSGNRFLTIDAV